MTPRTTGIRATLAALAVAAVAVPAAMARPVPIPDDGPVVGTNDVTLRPMKPSLPSTSPGAEITTSLYLQALAGSATTSR
jgi:hypothetical protein